VPLAMLFLVCHVSISLSMNYTRKPKLILALFSGSRSLAGYEPKIN
jgi:hypothetical protein